MPTSPVTAPATVRLTIPMTPDRRMAHNKSRGKSMWTMGDWIKADRQKAKLLARDYSLGAPGWTYRAYVRVTITIYWGKARSEKYGKVRQCRRLDWDSATALVKPMVDGALVDTGILADDRQIVAGTVLQEVSETGDGYTVIEIVPEVR